MIVRITRGLIAFVALAVAATSMVACQVPPGSFVFAGGGYGHGVGMSQWGAKGRADAGQGVAEILGAYFRGATIETTHPNGPRIKLGDTANTQLTQAASLTISRDGGGGGTTSSPPGEPLSVWADGDRVVAARAGANPGPVTIIAEAGAAATIDFVQGVPVSIAAFGRSYSWGRLSLRVVRAGTLEVVLDTISMQQYLRGVAEVPSSWPAAALQAQAIASRTYAAYRLAHPQSSRFDLYASTVDQAYTGASQESATGWIEAVGATDGQVLTHGGVPIQAFYSSSNGGWSEASEYVFVQALPYLRPVEDPYDAAAGNRNASWQQTYSGNELRAALQAAGWGDLGEISSIRVLDGQGVSGRLDRARILVEGTAGNVTISGNQLRYAVNASMPSSRDLLSTKFTVASGASPVPQSPPRGRLDHNVGVKQGAFVVGWATDADAPRAAVDVVLFVNGRLTAKVTADVDRPEIGPYLPGYGSRHGWAAFVPAPGRSTVCAYAIDIAPPRAAPAGPNTKLGCSVVRR